MTYEQVLEWIIDNYPIDMYDSFRDWYDDFSKESQLLAPLESHKMQRMLEDYWRVNGREQEQRQTTEEFEEPTTTTDQPVIEQTTITKRSDSNIVEEEQVVYRLPETGRAPEVFARPEPINMTPPPAEKKPSILSRVRRFLHI